MDRLPTILAIAGETDIKENWYLDHVYLLVPMQTFVGQFLGTFKEYPPRMKAASFTIDQVMEQLTHPQAGSG